jgi:hypothetical protein
MGVANFFISLFAFSNIADDNDASHHRAVITVKRRIVSFEESFAAVCGTA